MWHIWNSLSDTNGVKLGKLFIIWTLISSFVKLHYSYHMESLWEFNEEKCVKVTDKKMEM